MAFFEFAVEVFGVGIAGIDLLGIVPVEVVELDLHGIPLVTVVLGQHAVEDRDVAVIGEAQVADTSRLAFGHQKVEHAVADVSGLELLHAAAHADGMQQHVVDPIDPELLERIAVHGDRRLSAPGRGGEIR